MVNNLQLISRTFYSFICIMLLLYLTGLNLSVAMLVIGLTIFLFSMMFQYVAIDAVIRKTSTSHGRILFLITWYIISITGSITSALMMPQLNNLPMYTMVEDFTAEVIPWITIFTVFSSAFVAGACARRDHAKKGSLG